MYILFIIINHIFGMEGSINVKPRKKTCFVQQEIQEQNLTGFLTIVKWILLIILIVIIFMHDFQHYLREELPTHLLKNKWEEISM